MSGNTLKQTTKCGKEEGSRACNHKSNIFSMVFKTPSLQVKTTPYYRTYKLIIQTCPEGLLLN